MTDSEQLTFIIGVLKLYARKKNCYEKYGDFYDGTNQPHSRVFDDGIEYGEIYLARSILKEISMETDE